MPPRVGFGYSLSSGINLLLVLVTLIPVFKKYWVMQFNPTFYLMKKMKPKEFMSIHNDVNCQGLQC